MLKVGHRGYLQLAEGFDSPRWREGLVIGLQKEWVQTIVRCSEEEVEQFKLTTVDKGSGPRTLPERSRGDHLFPSMLVIPYASTQPSSSRRRARGRGREMAWGHVELLWTWFSFLEGGSPFKKSDQEALVARAQQVTWTKMHAEYAGCMHSEISKYIRLQSKQWQLSRGILKLSELVKVVKNSSYTSSSSIEKFCNVAKDVKPDRMSLPEVAGIINPIPTT